MIKCFQSRPVILFLHVSWGPYFMTFKNPFLIPYTLWYGYSKKSFHFIFLLSYHTICLDDKEGIKQGMTSLLLII